MKIKMLSWVCLIAICYFLTLPQAFALPPAANGCASRGLEEAVADSAFNEIVRSLRIDLNHGVSMIFFPGHPLYPAYAISLIPAKRNWALTYAVEKAKFAPDARAFRATVPLSISWSDMAQRVANVWDRAIAGANTSGAERNQSMGCVTVDGSGYVFSSNGRLASAADPLGNVPAQLLEISDTLRLFILDAKNTGYPVGLTIDRLQRQLNLIEGDLKIK